MNMKLKLVLVGVLVSMMALAGEGKMGTDSKGPNGPHPDRGPRRSPESVKERHEDHRKEVLIWVRGLLKEAGLTDEQIDEKFERRRQEMKKRMEERRQNRDRLKKQKKDVLE